MVNIWHTGNFPYGEKLPDIKNIDSRYCAHRNTPLDLASVTSRPTLQSPLSIFLQFLCLRRIASVSEELQVKFYVHFCRVSVCGMSPWSHPPPLYNLLLPAAFRPISLCKYNFFFGIPQTRKILPTIHVTIFAPSIKKQEQIEFDKTVGQGHISLRVWRKKYGKEAYPLWPPFFVHSDHQLAYRSNAVSSNKDEVERVFVCTTVCVSFLHSPCCCSSISTPLFHKFLLLYQNWMSSYLTIHIPTLTPSHFWQMKFSFYPPDDTRLQRCDPADL